MHAPAQGANPRQRRAGSLTMTEDEEAELIAAAALALSGFTIEQLIQIEAARHAWGMPGGAVSTVLETLLTGELAGTPPGETIH